MLKTPIIQVMTDAATKAGRALLRDFSEVEQLQVSVKGPGDFVSAADHRSERILVRELQKARPDYGFLLEEGEEIKGKGEFRFIIDPLDGTTNFLHGFPYFCISIGLEQIKDGEIVAGVIYAPVMDEMYMAEKGKGAFLNERKLLVSNRKDLSHALLSTGNFRCLKEGELGPRTKEVQNISNKVASIRLLGSSALELAYLAAGRLDGFWHTNQKPWDIAAGIILVKEAKGIITEIDGGANMLYSGSTLAANTHLHERIKQGLAA